MATAWRNINSTTGGAEKSALWWNDEIDLETAVIESIEQGEFEVATAKTRKPVITAQVVNISCECGGFCENASGSTMIDETDKVATCPDCGNTYDVPAKVFDKKLA